MRSYVVAGFAIIVGGAAAYSCLESLQHGVLIARGEIAKGTTLAVLDRRIVAVITPGRMVDTAHINKNLGIQIVSYSLSVIRRLLKSGGLEARDKPHRLSRLRSQLEGLWGT